MEDIALKINNYRLCQDDDTPLPFVPSPNIGGTLKPDLLIMHFTAGQNAAGAIQWLVNPKSSASSHIVIGQDTSITQLVLFDRIAYHAGASSWEGRTALNRYSIGIELDYPGPLKCSNDHWTSWFNKVYNDDEVIVAKAKYGARTYGWPKYPDVQIEAAVAVAALLVETYQLTEILGHEDIAQGRKWDPGPAFPMDDFRAEVFKRVQDASQVEPASG
jgi:N-acetylmuramoyl-L-alanine amidase